VGDYVQTPTGRIEFDLNGTAIGEFDRLFVDGQIQLDGILDLGMGGAYVPSANDVMTIISAPGGVLGQFAQVNQPMNMPAGLMFAVDYSQPQFVRVRVDRVAGLAADFNGDGIVDAGDLAQWRNNFGVDADADADGDGDSDGADFLVWQRQLGSSVPTPVLQSAVPEPAALPLAAIAAIAVCRRKRRS
jgi:hypothetical protein